jgi:geranylgeranyl diphosphate synthase type I
MYLEKITPLFLVEIEAKMKELLIQDQNDELGLFMHMMAYHLGWEGPDASREAGGKRIRPIILLLVTSACGGEWRDALSAAAAVEFIHNFSLIHDDIEDHSPLRRGRETVWKRWGIAQAINTGDAMFILAQIAILGIKNPEIALISSRLLQKSCFKLTQGQFLDISFENRDNISLENYWTMIAGKTASLLSTSCEIGSLIAHATETNQTKYQQFGYYLGLAFQVQDDFLGIWGDAALIGKSTESDLVSGKKSLPILFGIKHSQKFAGRWNKGSILPEETGELADMLSEAGSKEYVQNKVQELTDEAINWLNSAKPTGESGSALYELAEQLLIRNK